MIGFLYSVVGYAGFLAVFIWFAVFADGLWLTHTVDGSAGSGTPAGMSAVFINLGLILGFGLQHSVMARQRFKTWLCRFVPEGLERATFVWASSLALACVIIFWCPIPVLLWQVESPGLVALLWTVNALGWIGVPVTSFLIDHFDLFGLRQAFAHWRRQSLERSGFVTPWLYKYVRHPMMSSMFIALFVVPTMTLGHLQLALGMGLYILIGVHFEERSLVRELGLDYSRYQQRVPKFFPGFGRRSGEG